MSSPRQSQSSQHQTEGLHSSQGVMKSQHNPEDMYDPAKSTISADAMNLWLREPLTDEITQVPGLGAHYKDHLKQVPADLQKIGGEEPITTPYQLIGKYLMMKGEGVGCVDQANRFILWLKARGIKSGRNSVTEAIAEKCNLMVPGIYQKELFMK